MPINGKYTSTDGIEDLIETLNKAVRIIDSTKSIATENLGRFEGKSKNYTLSAPKGHFETNIKSSNQTIELISMVRDELLRNSKPSSTKIMRSFEDFKIE